MMETAGFVRGNLITPIPNVDLENDYMKLL
jgi:hypothetical protein